MKNRYIILPLIILVVVFTFFSACYCSDCGTEKSDLSSTIVFETGDELYVSIADDKEERAKGLMYVEKMGTDEGMVFVFEGNTTGKFWMKNTLIPLDMMFVDEDFKIVHIEHDVPPCKADPCPNYGSDQVYLYTLETNAGYAVGHGIEVGMEVELDIV